MRTKLFWNARRIYLKGQFFFRTTKYRFTHRIKEGERTTSFTFLLSKIIFWQTIKSLLYAGILLLGDLALLPIIENMVLEDSFPTMKLEIATDIVLGGMGVAGVILGLYCSNITSTYSTKYVNAPTNLATIFQRDIITNKCIQQIVGYIILCLVLLGESILHISISYVSLIAILIMTIRIIVVFSIAGNRINALSNTYQISENIYPEMITVLKRVSGKNVYANDRNFQNHFQKVCANKLNDLKDISLFNKNNPSSQNAATFLFMSKNIAFLEYYWSLKEAIRYDSLWYRDKVQYEPWHFASDTSVDVAIKTGTSPQPKTVRDYWWIESDIEEINEICFEKLCRDQDSEHIIKYINRLASLSSYAIDSGDTLSWTHTITKMQEYFTSCCLDGALSEKDSQKIAMICVAFVATFISMIMGANDYFRKFDLETLLNDVARMSSTRNPVITFNRLFNNRDVDDILHKISVETKLEGKRITPDWYIKQIASGHIVRFFNEILENISIICDNVVKFGTAFLEKKQTFAAAVIFAQFQQFISKSQITIAAINQNFNHLREYYFEPTIMWEDSKLGSARQKIEDVQKQLPHLLVQCSGAFALTHWSKREDYPDLLGFCYNYICEALISSIERNDFETFKGSYVGFLSVMLLYQEYVRTDVIKIKEPHRQQAVFHVATAPIIEYAMISSFAILWGEFNNSPKWKALVDSELQGFIKEDSGHISVLKRLAELASARKHHMFGIGNRDVLQTNWTQRIEQAIRNADLCEYEFKGFGQQVLKTDSKLLKAFCGSSFLDLGFSADIEDVYFICCINQHLPEESKYIGKYNWEERLDEE